MIVLNKDTVKDSEFGDFGSCTEEVNTRIESLAKTFHDSYDKTVLRRMKRDLNDKGYDFEYDPIDPRTLKAEFYDQFSDEETYISEVVTLEDFRTMFIKVSFSFTAQKDMIPSVLRYIAAYNRDSDDYTSMNCDPDTGEIYLSYKSIAEYPTVFNNDDFCFLVFEALVDALNICDELRAKSTGDKAGQKKYEFVLEKYQYGYVLCKDELY